MTEAANLAVAIYREALRAVAGDRLIADRIHREGDVLWVADYPVDLAAYDRIFLAGSGKASPQMILGLSKVLGDTYDGGLVITKRGNALSIPGIEVIEASHPVPDESSLIAGDRMRSFAADCRAKDLVLYALSGGSSSLMESLIPQISLADLQAISRLLLANGAEIGQINAIRSALSEVKSGALAWAFGPATVVVLVMSDVSGDDLSTIGSGPFYQGRGRDPIGIARQFDLARQVDFPLLEILRRRSAPQDKTRAIPHRVVGANRDVLLAAESAAKDRGLSTTVTPTFLTGEARELVGPLLANRNPGLIIAGGEPTVTIRGDGVGGRCQEMAVAAAELIFGQSGRAFLAGSTDGTDGPTEIAGGVVDSESTKTADYPPAEALATNNSQPFLRASGGLLETGPTGANVNDLFLSINLG
jgi:glycerate 2-kinase